MASAANTQRDAWLRNAKEQREWQIHLLRICDCHYPVVRCRNMTGHNPTCPAHVAAMQKIKEGRVT